MSIVDYVRDTRAEMKHVVWPTRAQTFAYSLAVVVLSLAVAVLLGASDRVFGILLKEFIGVN